MSLLIHFCNNRGNVRIMQCRTFPLYLYVPSYLDSLRPFHLNLRHQQQQLSSIAELNIVAMYPLYCRPHLTVNNINMLPWKCNNALKTFQYAITFTSIPTAQYRFT